MKQFGHLTYHADWRNLEGRNILLTIVCLYGELYVFAALPFFGRHLAAAIFRLLSVQYFNPNQLSAAEMLVYPVAGRAYQIAENEK